MPKGIIESLDFERRFGFIREDNPAEGEPLRRFFGFNESYLPDIKYIAVGDTVLYQLAPDRDPEKPDKAIAVRSSEAPDLLWDWAYFPSRAENLKQLADLALPEAWHFGGQAPAQRPTPILYNYLQYTFLKIQLERKLCFSGEESIAAFNTGLVTRMYQPIIAMFRKNTHSARQSFVFDEFCVPGEGASGKRLIRAIAGDMLPPEYFSDVSDLMYKHADREPEVDWRALMLDAIVNGHFPVDFLYELCTDAFTELAINHADMRGNDWDDLTEYLSESRGAKHMHRLQCCIDDALELALRRTRWNFKTAVPMWYPTRRTIHLLLPISLRGDDTVDLALVVEQIRHSGQKSKYIGHTLLPLDWAYMNARLLSRPDSDWLTPHTIPTVIRPERKNKENEIEV